MNLLLKIAVAALVTCVILVGGTLLFTARPTPVMGLDADALSHSVASSGAQCSEDPGGNWACAIFGKDKPTRYRVEANWLGCWDGARIAGPVTADTPEGISGCVDIWDHVRVEDAINGD